MQSRSGPRRVALPQGMSREEHGGLRKWDSVRSRIPQLSPLSGSGNSDAAAMHLSTPISRYETSYPHGAGMWISPDHAAICALTLPLTPYTACLAPCITASIGSLGHCQLLI